MPLHDHFEQDHLGRDAESDEGMGDIIAVFRKGYLVLIAALAFAAAVAVMIYRSRH
ncbi:MAG TPA: hypothetical protein VFQ72_02155 [Candidatus Paceibacterota bacterium]|nr:hypothetical protein [Candidatus Paceibacterota bacterium]